jgi:hypothetical protein
MVIVKLFGGLGNQLFQYCFGQYLANQLNTDVKYDVQCDKKSKNFTPRLLGLLSFNIEIETVYNVDIRKMKWFSTGLFERIERKIVQKFPEINKYYFVELDQHNVILSENLTNNCYYDGYWQSYKYLQIIEDKLRTEIIIKEIDNKAQLELIREIGNCQSVSLHVRRGDYISIKVNTKVFNLCSLEYYEDAIAYLLCKYKNSIFFVFSDDIEWANNNFKGDNFRFVTGNEPAMDMYLMSLCKHNIIANSTFSWWGAWLNTNVDKTVIAPKSWYNPNSKFKTKTLIPDTWVRI